MNYSDAINGCFECSEGLFTLINILRLKRDKQVKGVSILPTAVFLAWGFWNLFYYPHLGQWLSFTGGLLIVASNTAWVIMDLMTKARTI